MRYLTACLIAIALIAFATDARADDWSFDSYLKQHNQSEWNGFGVGTTLHRKMTQTISMPQMPAPQKTETEEKKTLVKINEDSLVIKVENLVAGTWQTTEKTEPKEKGWTHTVEEIGAESVTVAGTAYECKKKKVVWKDGETVKETVVLSVHAEKGILKMVIAGPQQTELVVAKFDQSWTLGETTVKGRELSLSVSTPMGKLDGTMRIAPNLPDGLVRQELRSGTNFEMLNELVAFVKK